MTRGPALLIFDCDGVLIDSEVVACRVWAEELTAAGIPVTARELMRRFGQMGSVAIMAELSARHGRPVPAGFKERFLVRHREALDAEVAAIDGVAAALGQLPVRKCVASNSDPHHIERYLRMTGLVGHFAPHLFSAALVARPKPAPDLFVHAAQIMGVAAADCLVIEDTARGVQAARAAGMRAFGFTGASHTFTGHGESLTDAGAECVFAAMAHLPALVAG